MSSHRGIERDATAALIGPRTSSSAPTATAEVTIEDRGRRQMPDPVRWSAVWAGTLIALALFVLLEVTFFEFGWLTLEQGERRDTTAGWTSLAIGIFAFLMGGLIASATSIWHHVREGVVHGLLVWALGVAAILLIALPGGGAVFGSTSDLFGQLGFMQASSQDPQSAQVMGAARDAAGWAALAMGSTLAAAVLGGAIGVKVGSSAQERPTHSS